VLGSEGEEEQSSTVGVATRVGKRRESFERTHPVEVETDDDGWREEDVAVANVGEERTALAATAAAAGVVGGQE
jgi:hypothetical protein